MIWRSMIGAVAVASCLAAWGCGGSAVDRELDDSAAVTTGRLVQGEPATPVSAPTPTPSALDAPSTGDEVVYGDTVYKVGAHVRLARRVGLLSPPSLGGGQQVEAAVGQTGVITAIRSVDGLVEVTWDAQQWTIHGGYAWQDSPNLEVNQIEGATSVSAGTAELESFTSAVHAGYLELNGP